MKFRIGKVVKVSAGSDRYHQYDMVWFQGGDDTIDSHTKLKLGRPGDVMVFGTRPMRVPFIYNSTTGDYLPTPSSGYNAGIMAICGMIMMGFGAPIIAILLWVVAIGLFAHHKVDGQRKLKKSLDEIAKAEVPYREQIEASRKRRAELLAADVS